MLGPNGPIGATLLAMIGNQIREARLRKKLSQDDAAKLAGVSRKQLWKLETGRGVTLETFRRVVEVLEMPVVTLGAVQVLPREVDVTRVLDATQTAIESLQDLATLIRAAQQTQSERTSDEALSAAAAIQSQPVTGDHPTVKALQQLLDAIKQPRQQPRT